MADHQVANERHLVSLFSQTFSDQVSAFLVFFQVRRWAVKAFPNTNWKQHYLFPVVYSMNFIFFIFCPVGFQPSLCCHANLICLEILSTGQFIYLFFNHSHFKFVLTGPEFWPLMLSAFFHFHLLLRQSKTCSSWLPADFRCTHLTHRHFWRWW